MSTAIRSNAQTQKSLSATSGAWESASWMFWRASSDSCSAAMYSSYLRHYFLSSTAMPSVVARICRRYVLWKCSVCPMKAVHCVSATQRLVMGDRRQQRVLELGVAQDVVLARVPVRALRLGVLHDR